MNYKGNTYLGETNDNGLPHGKGILRVDESSWNGSFINGKMNGFFEIRDDERLLEICALIEDGVFDQDQFIGTFKRTVIKTDDFVFYGRLNEEFGPEGPFFCRYRNGSFIKGYYINEKLNGKITLHLHDGSHFEGYMMIGKLDAPIYSKCHYSSEDLYDDFLQQYIDDFLEQLDRKQRSVTFDNSLLESLLHYLFKYLKKKEEGCGYLLFRKDGIFISESWDKPPHYERYAVWPYFIEKEEEVRYFEDLFYDTYHLHFIYLNDSDYGSFGYVKDYETFERICTL